MAVHLGPAADRWDSNRWAEFFQAEHPNHRSTTSVSSQSSAHSHQNGGFVPYVPPGPPVVRGLPLFGAPVVANPPSYNPVRDISGAQAMAFTFEHPHSDDGSPRNAGQVNFQPQPWAKRPESEEWAEQLLEAQSEISDVESSREKSVLRPLAQRLSSRDDVDFDQPPLTPRGEHEHPLERILREQNSKVPPIPNFDAALQDVSNERSLFATRQSSTPVDFQTERRTDVSTPRGGNGGMEVKRTGARSRSSSASPGSVRYSSATAQELYRDDRWRVVSDSQLRTMREPEDQQLAKCTFRPNINDHRRSRSAGPRTGGSPELSPSKDKNAVFLRLAKDDLDKRRHNLETAEREADRLPADYTFTPHINPLPSEGGNSPRPPKGKKVAEEVVGRLLEDIQERETRRKQLIEMNPPTTVPVKKISAKEEKEFITRMVQSVEEKRKKIELQHSFAQPAEVKRADPELIHRLYQDNRKKQAIESLQKAKENQFHKEYTFAPQISDRAKSMNRGFTHYTRETKSMQLNHSAKKEAAVELQRKVEKLEDEKRSLERHREAEVNVLRSQNEYYVGTIARMQNEFDLMHSAINQLRAERDREREEFLREYEQLQRELSAVGDEEFPPPPPSLYTPRSGRKPSTDARTSRGATLSRAEPTRAAVRSSSARGHSERHAEPAARSSSRTRLPAPVLSSDRPYNPSSSSRPDDLPAPPGPFHPQRPASGDSGIRYRSRSAAK
eukprot:TRINITY_DN11963_c0_g1_i1.p1 TRINITY_DN11963_c0_g1~~TRINITY_DN11963_c0_g1_i1.p1  ORF type:complete len:728 (-),score=85.20 TRINITY_DN11963_c0_g1_i1:104-2287(-)